MFDVVGELWDVVGVVGVELVIVFGVDFMGVVGFDVVVCFDLVVVDLGEIGVDVDCDFGVGIGV